MFALADRLKALRDEIKVTEELLKRINADIDDVDHRLSGLMAEAQTRSCAIWTARVVAFDFETSPLLPYREEPKAALDPHKSAIIGVSLSVAEGSAVYVPLHHFAGEPGGIYGPDTADAVRAFQKAARIQTLTMVEDVFLFKPFLRHLPYSAAHANWVCIKCSVSIFSHPLDC